LLGTCVHCGEHLVVTLDHGKDELLPKFGELTIRHVQGRLHLFDGCIPPFLRQERQVPAHLPEHHRPVHLVYIPVGLIEQRLGVSHDGVRNGSHWVTPFSPSSLNNRFHFAKCGGNPRQSQAVASAIARLPHDAGATGHNARERDTGEGRATRAGTGAIGDITCRIAAKRLRRPRRDAGARLMRLSHVNATPEITSFRQEYRLLGKAAKVLEVGATCAL